MPDIVCGLPHGNCDDQNVAILIIDIIFTLKKLRGIVSLQRPKRPGRTTYLSSRHGSVTCSWW